MNTNKIFLRRDDLYLNKNPGPNAYESQQNNDSLKKLNIEPITINPFLTSLTKCLITGPLATVRGLLISLLLLIIVSFFYIAVPLAYGYYKLLLILGCLSTLMIGMNIVLLWYYYNHLYRPMLQRVQHIVDIENK
jgi:hypothetical protein